MPVFQDLWTSVPPITRTILTISVLLTVSVSLDLCTPFKLYFNYNLIKRKYQVRLVLWAHVSIVLAHIHFTFLFWRVLCWYHLRLFHPLSILKHPWKALLPQPTCWLYSLLCIRQLHFPSFSNLSWSWVLITMSLSHDAIFVGSKKSHCSHQLPGDFLVPCSVPPLVPTSFRRHVWLQSQIRHYWSHCWASILLSWRRSPENTRDRRLEGVEATEVASSSLW